MTWDGGCGILLGVETQRRRHMRDEIWAARDVVHDMGLEKPLGKTSRGYVIRRAITLGDFDLCRDYFRIGVVGMIDKKTKDVCFDVYYANDGDSYWGGPWKFKPYPFEKFEMLCRNNDGDYTFNDKALMEQHWRRCVPEIGDDCTVERSENGGLRFRYNDKFRNLHSGVNLFFMENSFVGIFLHMYRRSLVLAVRYPNLDSVSDLVEVKNAFAEIDADWWRIRNRYYEEDIDLRLDVIKKLEADIHKLEEEKEKVFGECADSLNILSGRFGIEVDI